VPKNNQYTVWVRLNPDFIKENLKKHGKFVKSAITMVARMADVEPLYPLESELENKLWGQLLNSPIERCHGRPFLGAHSLRELLLTGN
jgi:hypothetical protein